MAEKPDNEAAKYSHTLNSEFRYNELSLIAKRVNSLAIVGVMNI